MELSLKPGQVWQYHTGVGEEQATFTDDQNSSETRSGFWSELIWLIVGLFAIILSEIATVVVLTILSVKTWISRRLRRQYRNYQLTATRSDFHLCLFCRS